MNLVFLQFIYVGFELGRACLFTDTSCNKLEIVDYKELTLFILIIIGNKSCNY